MHPPLEASVLGYNVQTLDSSQHFAGGVDLVQYPTTKE